MLTTKNALLRTAIALSCAWASAGTAQSPCQNYETCLEHAVRVFKAKEVSNKAWCCSNRNPNCDYESSPSCDRKPFDTACHELECRVELVKCYFDSTQLGDELCEESATAEFIFDTCDAADRLETSFVCSLPITRCLNRVITYLERTKAKSKEPAVKEKCTKRIDEVKQMVAKKLELTQ